MRTTRKSQRLGRVHKKRLEEMEPISGPLITVKMESVGRSVCPTLQPARLLCPWNSLGKNTGVGHSLLRGALPNPGIKSRLKPKFLEHYCSQTLAGGNRLHL